MRTLIVDGNHALHRVCSVHTTLQTSTGVRTGGIFGLLNSLKISLERFPDVYRVVVAWDCGRSSRRLQLHPEYKANRDVQPTDTDKKSRERAERREYVRDQAQRLEYMLPFFGVRQCKVPGKEGDDVIAVLLEGIEGPKVLVSEDKDMYQLVSDDVLLYRPMKDESTDPTTFAENTGTESRPLFLLKKALLGDTSDNIPGIKGVGDVIATRAVNRTTECLPAELRRSPELHDAQLMTHLRSACEALVTEDKRNRKKYQKICESEEVLRTNLDLVDLTREPFSDVERQYVLDCLHPGNRVPFAEVEAVRVLQEYELASILQNLGWWTTTFNRLQ